MIRSYIAVGFTSGPGLKGHSGDPSERGSLYNSGYGTGVSSLEFRLHPVQLRVNILDLLDVIEECELISHAALYKNYIRVAVSSTYYT